MGVVQLFFIAHERVEIIRKDKFISKWFFNGGIKEGCSLIIAKNLFDFVIICVLSCFDASRH